jgi:hypothetical protein
LLGEEIAKSFPPVIDVGRRDGAGKGGHGENSQDQTTAPKALPVRRTNPLRARWHAEARARREGQDFSFLDGIVSFSWNREGGLGMQAPKATHFGLESWK